MPTVFISYSWDTDAHKAWVRRFGDDLRARGITVWLDQFELRLGDDVTAFMERGVSQADYVLLVCTEGFGRKANERRGGVGYEQAIVTAEILSSNPVRGRFVCILRQGLPSSALPAYMRSRLWLDCRDDSAYATALDQIVEHVLAGRGAPPSTDSALVPPSGSPSMPPAPYGEPKRWVLVAGTGASRGFSQELEALSRTLGERLASARCGLVTGGWPGVDEWVARSFAEAAHELRAPLEDALVQVIVTTDEPPFAAGQLVFVNKGEEEWSEPIHRGDVVLLLGGLGGTRETGRRALQMRKPVLPIADTGGDAKAFYVEMLKTWPTLDWMGLTEQEFRRLGRPASSAIEAAVELAQRAQRPA
jgi:hypothetical protein